MSREICGNFDETDVTCSDCIRNRVQRLNACYEPVKHEKPVAEKENKMSEKTNVDLSQVDHPKHYQQDGRLECLEEMLLMFGKENVITWCRMTAYKYYYRAGNKEHESADKDRAKAMFYLNYVKKLQEGG